MTIAVAFGGEEQGTVGTFEGFLTGVGEDVTTQGTGPGEHSLTVGTGDAIWSHAVGRFLLLVFGVRWIGVICARVVAFGSTTRCNKSLFVTVINGGGVSRATID